MNEIELLKKRIKQTELQLKKLELGTKNEVTEDLISSLILQKAVLKKDLELLGKNPLVEKFKKIIPHKEKLICDYFN